jgi:hypothetical protein
MELGGAGEVAQGTRWIGLGTLPGRQHEANPQVRQAVVAVRGGLHLCEASNVVRREHVFRGRRKVARWQDDSHT